MTDGDYVQERALIGLGALSTGDLDTVEDELRNIIDAESGVDDSDVVERLEEVKEQFDVNSDEYADISMTISYLEDPEYHDIE